MQKGNCLLFMSFMNKTAVAETLTITLGYINEQVEKFDPSNMYCPANFVSYASSVTSYAITEI
jgi:hypothetical protein